MRYTSFNIIYVLLLLYAIAALLFWGLSLQKQSRTIYEIERADLQHQIDSFRHPVLYQQRLAELNDRLSKRHGQYIGEGSTLLAILLFGAAVVYTSLQRRVRLQRLQTNFMLAVTHELKSPIAGVKLSIQTLQRHKLSEEQRAQLLSRCIQEADRLSELCNNMLVTSQIEGRQYKSANEPISMEELAQDSAHTYSARYPSRIHTDLKASCFVQGDLLLLHMALNNLLENAIKYTPDNSKVTLRSFQQQSWAVLQVADVGSGIADQEKKKIFNKFYRVGDEDTRCTKGTGLGLYLTKRIVRQHKGKITVKDNVPSGTVFSIWLPCTNA
ncbi:MAG: two-component sensor histidine kinase [Bacteroidetes bacterium]|nr:two-component sensor histidine kinase [Bacteroidota bacterium]MBS1629199.1 two-component sensor histidine kinase [Bacteroidota bacterium]